MPGRGRQPSNASGTSKAIPVRWAERVRSIHRRRASSPASRPTWARRSCSGADSIARTPSSSAITVPVVAATASADPAIHHRAPRIPDGCPDRAMLASRCSQTSARPSQPDAPVAASAAHAGSDGHHPFPAFTDVQEVAPAGESAAHEPAAIAQRAGVRRHAVMLDVIGVEVDHSERVSQSCRAD